MRETDESNLEAEVILDEKKSVILKRTASLLRLVSGTDMKFIVVECKYVLCLKISGVNNFFLHIIGSFLPMIQKYLR